MSSNTEPGVKHALRVALLVAGPEGLTRQEIIDLLSPRGYSRQKIVNAIQTMSNQVPVEIVPNGQARYSETAKRRTLCYVRNPETNVFMRRLNWGIKFLAEKGNVNAA